MKLMLLMAYRFHSIRVLLPIMRNRALRFLPKAIHQTRKEHYEYTFRYVPDLSCCCAGTHAGKFFTKKNTFSGKFCIPAPVIGGLLFAIFTCICYSTGVAEFSFDDTLREVCMVFFFTSVGFQANLKVLKVVGNPWQYF